VDEHKPDKSITNEINVTNSPINTEIGGINNIITIEGGVTITKALPPSPPTCPTPKPPPDHFGGRGAALNDLKALVGREATVAITALHGLGGIGKTTLARQLAYDLYQSRQCRAILWAEVTASPDPRSVLQEWGQYADYRYATPDLPIQQIAQQVKAMLDKAIPAACAECDGNRVLVVFDNVWDSSREAVTLLREACPQGSVVLITTRSANVAIDLGARPKALDRLKREEGIDLLRSYLSDVDDVDEGALGDLSDVLGGHALALTIAVKRVQKKSNLNKAISEHLDAYRTGVAQGDLSGLTLGTGENSEQSVALALSYSYDDLSGDDRRCFRALGVLAPDVPFDLNLLAAIWATTAEQTEQFADTLRLRSLIEADTKRGEGWHQQHPLLRGYALKLLKKEREDADVFARYADRVIAIAGAFRTLPPEQWKVLDPYLPHITIVGEELVRQVLGGATPQRETVTDTAKSDTDVLRRGQQFALNTSRYLANRRAVRHIPWTVLGLATSRALNDKREQARYLNDLGLVYDALGEKRRALEYYEQALPLSREVGDKGGEATTLNNIGGVYDALGEKRRALEYYEQALPLSREVGDKGGEAVTCFNIGLTYRELGDLDRAVEYVERCVALDRLVEHPDLASDMAMLEQLKRERDGGAAGGSEQADAIR
jgi:tetratricopeptide (TPR) repeat protein